MKRWLLLCVMLVGLMIPLLANAGTSTDDDRNTYDDGGGGAGINMGDDEGVLSFVVADPAAGQEEGSPGDPAEVISYQPDPATLEAVSDWNEVRLRSASAVRGLVNVGDSNTYESCFAGISDRTVEGRSHLGDS